MDSRTGITVKVNCLKNYYTSDQIADFKEITPRTGTNSQKFINVLLAGLFGTRRFTSQEIEPAEKVWIEIIDKDEKIISRYSLVKEPLS